MNTREMRVRFDELTHKMASSGDIAQMKLFGIAFSNMFDKVSLSHLEWCKATLDFLSAIEFNNFVTQEEALHIASGFINDDMGISGATEPSKGAHWSMDTLKTFLMQKGLPLEEKPCYNWPALWLAVNMEYSDYADAFYKIFGYKDNEKIAIASYTMATKILKDRDRTHFIRRYFDLDAE